MIDRLDCFREAIHTSFIHKLQTITGAYIAYAIKRSLDDKLCSNLKLFRMKYVITLAVALKLRQWTHTQGMQLRLTLNSAKYNCFRHRPEIISDLNIFYNMIGAIEFREKNVIMLVVALKPR